MTWPSYSHTSIHARQLTLLTPLPTTLAVLPVVPERLSQAMKMLSMRQFKSHDGN